MNTILFTKPKQVTFECLKFLVEQQETILGVVLYGKDGYAQSEFARYCAEKRVPIYDFSETDQLFSAHQNEIDMVCSNTFPKRLESRWINAARVAAINFHSAPLPEYRGAFTYNFAFLNHENEYGVTCHFLTERFDEGNIIEVVRFPFDFAHGSVKELVALSGQYMLQLFRRTYLRFKNGEHITGVPQSAGQYYSRKDFERAKQVLLTDRPDSICDKIRAFWYPPFECAYVTLNGQKVMLVPEAEYKKLVD